MYMYVHVLYLLSSPLSFSPPPLSLLPSSLFLSQVRVLVTHGLGFLPQCDKIVVMDKGRITEVGSYSELIDMDGVFAEFLRNYATREENKEGDPSNNMYT